MPDFLCISVRFLNPAFHGRGDQGDPEWPPSPLRVFQALVAAAAGYWNERTTLKIPYEVFCWLEKQPAPLITAPIHTGLSARVRLYVPNNSDDLAAKQWIRGGAAVLGANRIEKDVQSVRLPTDNPSVHYLYPIKRDDPTAQASINIIAQAAHSLTHLGWGIDTVAGHAEIITETQAASLPGNRWVPTPNLATGTYRVPTAGTLDALTHKHAAFLGRIDGPDSFKPVPPLSTFAVTGYRTNMEHQAYPFAAYSLLKPDASGFRPFDTPRRLKAVAGMLRNAAKRAALNAGWEPPQVNQYILGHAEQPGEPHRAVDGPRLAFLPVPSIQFQEQYNQTGAKHIVVSEIRRVIVAQLGGENTHFKLLTNLLSGTELIPKPLPEPANSPLFADELEWDTPSLPDNGNQPLAMLARLPNSENTITRYVRPAATWATVTPVILPGYDDPRHLRRRLGQPGVHADEQKRLLEKLDQRVDALLRQAITQAGYPQELAQHAQLEWQGTGFWPGVELAARYSLPLKLKKFPRVHVRITWLDRNSNRVSVPGPICIGGGRFNGFGLFAAN